MTRPRRAVHIPRTFYALLAAAALAVAPATSAAAEVNYRGPACANIIEGSALYNDSGVHARMTLQAPACKGVAYTLYVLDDAGQPVVTTVTGATNPDQPGFVFFDAAVPTTAGDTICVYVTTSRGKHVFDRAPDDGCASLTKGGGIPGQGFH